MYHLELRHFPHTVWRFNLTEQQLRVIVAPWVRGEIVELGEHKWNPEQARLTILDGPEIALGQLTLGRGWSTAERHSEDVTERVLAAARSAGAPTLPAPATPSPASVGTPAPAAVSAPAPSPPADAFALGVQMAALLGSDPMRLLEAWRAAAASSPGRAPSETLALAEQAIASAD